MPRIPLMEALADKSVVVRSDQIPVKLEGGSVEPVPGSPKKPKAPKHGKIELGSCYVDYLL